ncbi:MULTISPECIES: helix-turn-helix transcriptional regulator [unclassified Frankia]
MARKQSGLTARRRAMGYSQESFAHELDVDRTTVGRWERGDVDACRRERCSRRRAHTRAIYGRPPTKESK